MATSGSVNYNETANSIVKAALSKLTVVGENREPTPAQYTTGREELNRMIKHWMNIPINLWIKTEAVLIPTPATASYTLNSTGANWTVKSDFGKTEIGAAEASGQTTITVDSTTGMAASDVIIIEQDDDTVKATTISSVTDSTTVVIAASLSAASAVDSNVYFFTTKYNKPLDVLHARLNNGEDSFTVLQPLSREQYFALPNRLTAGSPTHYYFDRQLSNGVLYLYPVPNDPHKWVELTVARYVEDFDTASDDPDFPQEWLDALVWNLAKQLAPNYGKAEYAALAINQIADLKLIEVSSYDVESTSVFFQPE